MDSRAVAVLWIAVVGSALSTPIVSLNSPTNMQPDFCNPLVIAHRGASGYVPEHTLAAYSYAIFMGADYVEPDLVMTKDGQLIARHDNELGLTTNVAQLEEFANRRRTQTIDGKLVTGWFSEDFTLAEIKNLRAIERIPDIRPGNARSDLAFEVATLQEIINMVQSLQKSEKRIIGIYPEIKHSTHFKRLGLPMEKLVVDTLHSAGYLGPRAPIYIQSFEVNNLKELKNLTNLRLLQLFEGDKLSQPFDQAELGTGLTYADMSTPEGLLEVAKYASAVGPDKGYIIPRDAEDKLGEPTSFVIDAHNAGLKVHPYTFRAENPFLPAEFRNGDSMSAVGDISGELRAFLATGIDGLFVDQPDMPLNLRGSCQIVNTGPERSSKI